MSVSLDETWISLKRAMFIADYSEKRKHEGDTNTDLGT